MFLGKHEVFLLKETSTCSYEIIILTPLLCSHPKYKPKDTGDLKINCLPLEGAEAEPYSLRKLKSESAKLRKNAEVDRIKVGYYLSRKPIAKWFNVVFKVELIQFKPEDAITAISGDSKSPKFVTDKVADTTPVKEFLQGKYCLYGGEGGHVSIGWIYRIFLGTGWWKFEFCYGKSVEQFHIERDGSRTSINLGMFNKQKHLDWIKEHPHKRPKPVGSRRQLSHFYSDVSFPVFYFRSF